MSNQNRAHSYARVKKKKNPLGETKHLKWKTGQNLKNVLVTRSDSFIHGVDGSHSPCSNVSHQVGLLESCDCLVTLQRSSVHEFFAYIMSRYLLIID